MIGTIAPLLARLSTSLVEYRSLVGSIPLEGRSTRSGTRVAPDQPTPEHTAVVEPVRSRPINHLTEPLTPSTESGETVKDPHEGIRPK